MAIDEASDAEAADDSDETKKANDEMKAPASGGNAIAALAEAAQVAALASPSVDTTLGVHFFGRNGRDIVTEQDFLACALRI